MSDAKNLSAQLADIIGRLAHDLKNPLAVVLSNLRYLESQVEDPDFREAAMEGAISAERLGRMIDDAAELESLRTLSSTINRDPVRLSQLGETIHQKVELQLGSRALTIEMPDETINTDGGLLERALVNLLEHAIRRTPSRGRISLVVYCNPKSVVIQLTDGGPPFDPEQTPSILATELTGGYPPQTGYRSDRGLGLFFAGIACRALDAKLNIENRPNNEAGVIFTIVLPR